MPLRLFVDHPFALDTPLRLRTEQNHYLMRVMRCKAQDIIYIFNGKQGLWLGTLSDSLHVVPQKQILDQPTAQRTVALAFSPIKQQNWLIEKATEMGVTDFYPLLCHRTVVRHFSEKRHIKIIHEACEQSHRLHIPTLHPLQNLNAFLHAQRDKNLCWTVLNPGSASPLGPKESTIGLCIGPEGGWSPQEINHLQEYSFIKWAHLGQSILRAETAAVASLAIAQNVPE